jgi:uncharacterized alkaline shock family protein YloU
MADQQPPDTSSATPTDAQSAPEAPADEARPSPEAPADKERSAPEAPGEAPADAGSAGGEFEIGDTVIAKIAHMACREVEGVHALGGATSRALSSLRVADARTQGVTVDLRGDSVDVDITLVVAYGRSIPEVAQACRERVRERIEATTGLAVKAINVVVSDIYFPEGTGTSGADSGQA